MMATQTDLTTEEAYEIADSFAQASARVLDFRISNRATLTREESAELEKCEDRLDHLVVLFRGYGIQLIGTKAAEAIAEIKDAIGAAKTAIENAAKVKNAIKLASGLVDLAMAIVSKNPKTILEAAKAVKLAASGVKGKPGLA
jgi:hypothetical protein